MSVVARSAVALSIVLLAAGCTTVIAGTVRPAPGLIPTPVTGASVRQVLLDDAELSNVLDQDFRSDPNLPPRFGGVDDLPDGWASAVPGDCVGTLVGAQKIVYQSLQVQDAAHEFWAGSNSERSQLTGVAEGVIALPTAADAEAAFEKFSEQWARCDGTTVTRNDDVSVEATGKIADVSAGDSMLTATVQTTLAGSPGLWVTRALGVRVNCLVDVDVFASSDGSDGPPGPPGGTGAADIARAMMDRVRELAG